MRSSLRSGVSLKRHRSPDHTTTTTTTTKTVFTDLPTELLFSILSRLPVTSLVQSARYVCKLWRSIITNNSIFTASQFLHNQTPGYLFSLTGNPNLYYLDDNLTAVKLPGDFGNGTKYNQLVSCRGLMCYHSVDDRSIYVCNPVINDRFKLNLPYFREIIWGFGYAVRSGKYKYVQFSLNKQVKPARLAGVIYTLGDESWRELELDFSVDVPNFRWCVYCNGALYWSLWCLPNGKRNYDVVSFDLETEKFRTRRVFQSCSVNERGYWHMRLDSWYVTVLGEEVGLVICFRNGLQEVWVLIDEVKDVWDLKYSFFAPASGTDKIGFKLLGFWINQDFYVMEKRIAKRHGEQQGLGSVYHKVIESKCLSYNVDRDTYSEVQLPFARDLGGGVISPEIVINHVGSFISPSKIVATARNEAIKQAALVTE